MSQPSKDREAGG
uniref:Uncharacterized protein n=1 Tax=Anguilla anguilla TaxID=7936 RepID=A0A0E9TC26_ANGAN